jgi:hypothetical protein
MKFGIWWQDSNGTCGWVNEPETGKRAEYATRAEAVAVARDLRRDDFRYDVRYTARELD